MQNGNILVARADVPYRFQTIKPGTLWKVVGLRGGDRITVGDQNHPAIQTRAGYFHVLSAMDVQQLKKLDGTDMAARIKAILAFGPTTVLDTPYGFRTAKYEGKTSYIPVVIANALSKANPTKTVQSQLARG